MRVRLLPASASLTLSMSACTACTGSSAAASRIPKSIFLDQTMAPPLRAASVLVERRHAVADGELDERRQVVEVKLAHDADAIGLDRARRELEDPGHLRVRLAFGHQAHDFALARVQGIDPLAHRRPQAVEHLLGDALAEIALARRHGADRLDELRARAFLAEIAPRAR